MHIFSKLKNNTTRNSQQTMFSGYAVMKVCVHPQDTTFISFATLEKPWKVSEHALDIYSLFQDLAKPLLTPIISLEGFKHSQEQKYP